MCSKFCSYDPVNKIWSGRALQQIYNTDANVGYLFLQKLIQSPQSVCQISDDTGVKLTNLDVYRRSLKFANFFTKMELKQGDIVGLISSNHENLVPIIIGCLTLGVAINPLYTAMNADDIMYMWCKLKPKIIFSDADVVGTVKSAVDKIGSNPKIYTMMNKVDGFNVADDILNEEFDVEDFYFRDLPNISSTIAIISCSSGTTSAPKGICKSHKQIIAHAFLIWERNLNGTDIIFNSMPSFWTLHIQLTTLGILYNIPVVISAQPLNPELWVDIVDKHKVTVIFTSPRFGSVILTARNLRKLESVRFLTMGGSVFTEKLIKDLNEILPNGMVAPGYGLTEADCVGMHMHKNEICGLSSGYPFVNTKIKIVDENGISQDPNQVGEILYKPAVPFSAYFGDPESYSQSFDADGFVKSGDMGYFDDCGRIYIIDRIKHMIKGQGSYKLTPSEVEAVINEIDGIIQSSVIGVFDDELFYELVCAFVVKDGKNVELTEDFIENYVNARVIKEKRITGGVHFIDKIPTTVSGKVLNRKLRDIASELLKNKKRNG